MCSQVFSAMQSQARSGGELGVSLTGSTSHSTKAPMPLKDCAVLRHPTKGKLKVFMPTLTSSVGCWANLT